MKSREEAKFYLRQCRAPIGGDGDSVPRGAVSLRRARVSPTRTLAERFLDGPHGSWRRFGARDLTQLLH